MMMMMMMMMMIMMMINGNIMINELSHDKTNKMTCVPSEDSAQVDLSLHCAPNT